MEKDFGQWMIRKENIHASPAAPVLFHEREVWWCALGANIGSEQDGINERFERPVLVLKKFNQQVLWVLPLTRARKSSPYYFQIPSDLSSSVVLSQIRLVSSKRLLRRMSTITPEEFSEIVKRVKNLLPK